MENDFQIGEIITFNVGKFLPVYRYNKDYVTVIVEKPAGLYFKTRVMGTLYCYTEKEWIKDFWIPSKRTKVFKRFTKTIISRHFDKTSFILYS